MASIPVRAGKCSNFGNCSIADARRTVEVPGGLDFVCTECGKPLVLAGSAEAAGGRKTWGVGALVAALVVACVAWFFLRDKASLPAAAPPVVVVQPADPARPAVPVTGDCSDADQRTGLCTRAR